MRFQPRGCLPVWIEGDLVERRIDEMRPRPIPGAAPGIVGIIPVGSRAVPLLDLAYYATDEFRSHEEQADEAFALLVKVGDMPIALLATDFQPDPVERNIEEWPHSEGVDYLKSEGGEWWIDIARLFTKLAGEQ